MGTSDDSGLFKAALLADQTVKLAHLAERYRRGRRKNWKDLCVEDIQIDCCSRTWCGCSQSKPALERFSRVVRSRWLIVAREKSPQIAQGPCEQVLFFGRVDL